MPSWAPARSAFRDRPGFAHLCARRVIQAQVGQESANPVRPDAWRLAHERPGYEYDGTGVPDRPHPDGWARCLPSENHCKGVGEWNHYRVEANDGVIKLAVNGQVVSGVNKCTPRKGYLGLESEGSECHFKNLKIKELPQYQPEA